MKTAARQARSDPVVCVPLLYSPDALMNTKNRRNDAKSK